MFIAAVLAAVLFVLRGFMEPHAGGPYFLLGGLITAAILYRYVFFRGE